MRPPRHLLILRFTLVNVVALALALAAWLQGWLDDAFIGASLWLCLIIIAAFVYGLGLCGLRLWQVGRELDDAHDERPRAGTHLARYLAQVQGAAADSRATAASLLRLRLSQSLAAVRHVAGMLVLLGLVGTVIGFVVALSGVDPVKVPSVENVAPMVARLINGMSIALYTTLVGSVLNLWLMVGQRILAGGSLALYAAIVELGERHARGR
jgi:hypothetical protein